MTIFNDERETQKGFFFFKKHYRIFSMGKRLGRAFYLRPTLEVAQELLGKILVRKRGKKVLRGKIVETEAYIGPEDRASHAYRGKITKRNQAEYFKGGYVYIYLVYGMYWQLNVVTGPADKPECVLIRALEPVIRNSDSSSKDLKALISLTNGPGKLCRWMALAKSFYGEDLTKSKRLWIEEGEIIRRTNIIRTSRIGIDYAGPYWAKKPWRFYLKDNPFVSKR